MDVEVEGVSEDELREVLVKKYGWDELSLEQLEGKVLFSGNGYIGNAVSEEGFHDEIYQTLKTMRPDCKVITKWTNLEHIPYSVYGDDLDE